MSGFVGFDAERVGWLWDAMRRASDELLRSESTDPAAQPAMTRLRRARSTLGVWIPKLDQLVAEQAGATTASVVDLGAWAPLAWLVAHSPANATADQLERAAMARDEARAIADALELAEFLGNLDVWDLSSPDVDLARLTDQFLDLTAHPTAVRAFLSSFDGWERLMAAVATQRASAEDDVAHDRDDVGAADQLQRCDEFIAALGAVIVAGSVGANRPGHRSVFARIDPYAAALLLPHLELSGQALADAATQIVRRWHDLPTDDIGWIDWYHDGDNTIDLVFRQLARDPDASTWFLDAAVDRPETVVMGARHPSTMEQVLWLGTRHDESHATRVGAIVVPIIDWLRNGPRSAALVAPGSTMVSRSAIADIVAEWVLYFGPRADDWGWTFRKGDDALRWIVDDDAAMGRFLDGLLADQDELDSLRFADSEGRVADDLIREQTMMFTQVESVIEDARVDDAAADAAKVNLGVMIVEQVASMVIMPQASGLGATVRDAVVSATVSGARKTLERVHVLPPTPEDVRKIASRDRNERTVDRAVIATVTVVTQLIELGELPANVLEELQMEDLAGDPACSKAARLNDWVDDLEPRLGTANYNLVVAVRNGFLNQSDVVDMCR